MATQQHNAEVKLCTESTGFFDNSSTLMSLVEILAPNLFLVNCNGSLRNTVCSLGHEDRLLDKEKGL